MKIPLFTLALLVLPLGPAEVDDQQTADLQFARVPTLPEASAELALPTLDELVLDLELPAPASIPVLEHPVVEDELQPASIRVESQVWQPRTA